ncbi:MAG: GNAT family N-acetyltransferase [Polyangiaceae bacterium]|nr:GNAT family N-acetyltransferase [Polyangiaceae bacterium]
MSHRTARITIRRAEPRDAAAIARVHVDSWQAAYLGLIPASVLNRLTVAGQTASWTRLLRGGGAPGSRTWLLTLAGEVVGFSSVGPTRDDDDDGEIAAVGEVYTLYLAPASWGRGLGGELLDAAQADLARRGFRAVTIWVLAGNTRARRFYELAGFDLDGARRPVRIDPVTLPEVRYRRAL